MEYARLRAEGVHLLERWTGQHWTDFNSHDPGITILEQVCWALNDLGYRLDHPIPDLLCEGAGNADTGQLRGIAPPAEALGCAPVTLADLRRLILDIDHVINVWIEPDETPETQLYYHRERHTLSTEQIPETLPLQLQGLWRVRIASDDSNQNEAIKRAAGQRLYAQRPLGIDFSRIEVLGFEDILVDAQIEIGATVDAESLLVELLRQISAHISPRVTFRTLQDYQTEDAPLEELFDGPRLEYGFIDDSDLPDAQRRTSLRTSDLIRQIMDVPGVRAVRHIRLAKAVADLTEAHWQDWELKLDHQEPNPKTARLDLQHSTIQLYRQQVPVRIDAKRVLDRYQLNASMDARRLPDLSERAPNLPLGRDRRIARYHSILHQFPEIYGVGPAGLPPHASVQRQGQMKQLKAYLQLFDQLLADQFAQAANAAGLLAGDDPTTPTYSVGSIEPDGLELEQVRTDGYQAALNARAKSTSESPEGIALRRRQLDHLLARVGETFVDTISATDDTTWDGLEERRALLAVITDVAAKRGNAVNSLLPFGTDNRGGLEHRIALKLGLREEQGETFLLVEHLLLRALPGDQIQTEPLLTEVASDDPYSLQLSFVFPGDVGRFAEVEEANSPTSGREGFRCYVEHLIRQETPAHLSVYIHWLATDAYDAFKQDLARWHERRRTNLLRRFNIQEGGT
jgi:hypothetical protein